MPLPGVIEVSGLKYILVEECEATKITPFKILEDAMTAFAKAKTNTGNIHVWLCAILKEVIP